MNKFVTTVIDWSKERDYCRALEMKEVNQDRFEINKQPDVYIQFYTDHWEFWSNNIMVYQSTTDNLSYVLECNSATSSTCPICGNSGETDDSCCAYYFEETNVTVFWSCDRDSDHHIAMYGYRLDERDHVKQLQERLVRLTS